MERIRYTAHEFLTDDVETDDEGLFDDDPGKDFEEGRISAGSEYEWGFRDLNVLDNIVAIIASFRY